MIDWNSIDQQVGAIIQNDQPPDVLNLNSFSSYAKDGLGTRRTRRSPQDARRLSSRPSRGGTYRTSSTGSPSWPRARLLVQPRSARRTKVTGRTWDELVQAARKVQGHMIGYALHCGREKKGRVMRSGCGTTAASGSRATPGRSKQASEEQVQTLQFLAGLANTHKVTQVNPGKTPTAPSSSSRTARSNGDGLQPPRGPLDGEGEVPLRGTDADRTGAPVTLGVEDYLMAFKKKGNQEAAKVPRPLLPAGEHHALDRREGFLPGHRSGAGAKWARIQARAYLDALPNARLAPTTDPASDKVKLDVSRDIGLAAQPGGNPKQVLDGAPGGCGGERSLTVPRPREAAAAEGAAVAGERCFWLGPSLSSSRRWWCTRRSSSAGVPQPLFGHRALPGAVGDPHLGASTGSLPAVTDNTVAGVALVVGAIRDLARAGPAPRQDVPGAPAVRWPLIVPWAARSS